MIAQSRLHLAEAGETYGDHLRFAATVGAMAMAAGLACIVHAIVPALCQRTASRTIGLLTRLFGQRELLDEVRARSLEAIAFVALTVMAIAVSVMLALSPAPAELKAIYIACAFALPATLLLTNRELECRAD